MSEPATVTEATIAAALRRAGVYRLLAGAFSYPTAPRLDEIARSARVLADALEPGPLRDAIGALGDAAGAADPAVAGQEYVFLFDRQVRCPPYEGAYGDGPQLAGKPAALADIAGFYEAFGLTPAGAQPETEDHIVAELEFMSALAMKHAWALETEDAEGALVTRAAQRAFLAEHLGRWAGAFAREVGAVTTLPSFASAAALLAEWVQTDARAIDIETAPVAGRLGLDPLQQDVFTCPMAGDQEETMEPTP